MAVLFRPADPYSSRSASIGSYRSAPIGSSRSASIGSSIGEGLAQTLNMLTQNKLLQQQQNQQQQQRQQELQQFRQYQNDQKMQKAFNVSEGLASMGVPREMSEKIAFLPEKQQELFLSQFMGSEAFGAPQQQQALSGQLEQGLIGGQEAQGGEDQLEALLGQQPEQLVQQPQFDAPGELGAAPQQLAPGQAMPGALTEVSAPIDLAAATKQIQERVASLSPKEKKSLKAEIKLATDAAARRVAKPMAKAVPTGASKEAKPGYRLQAKPTAKKSFRELLSTPRPTAADRKRTQDLEFKRARITAAKQRSIDANTKEYYNKTLAGGKDARANDMRLARMKELNKRGNLSNPAFASLLNTVKHGLWGVGLNLKFLQSADSQEFDKLSTDFLKNAKSIFGSRVTEGEIKLFLQTIPTLSQTKEARNRVIRNMKMLNEGAKIRKKAMFDVIKSNGGERPRNMEVLIETKIGPKLDKISEAFRFSKKKKGQKPSRGGVLGTLGAIKDYLEG